MKYFYCTKQGINLLKLEEIRWLDPDEDYELSRQYWAAFGQKLSQFTWKTANNYGYQYAGFIIENVIISIAAAWKFSDKVWEVAAVSTLEAYRRLGYSKQVVMFVTKYIIDSGRLASCSTNDNNLPMTATALSIGFQEISVDKVWWKYPNLPDF
jgi:predicted GNAT family acetyltransferase